MLESILNYSLLLGFMVCNATFNNISVISWRSVLLVEETGVHGENHRPVASHSQILNYQCFVSLYSQKFHLTWKSFLKFKMS